MVMVGLELKQKQLPLKTAQLPFVLHVWHLPSHAVTSLGKSEKNCILSWTLRPQLPHDSPAVFKLSIKMYLHIGTYSSSVQCTWLFIY